MTPLSVTKTAGEGSFDRLAPLPAPKFRSAHSRLETDGFLKGGQETMGQLKIEEPLGTLEDELVFNTQVQVEQEEAVDVSPGGHVTKRRARSRPVSWELMDDMGRNVHVCLFR